MVALCLLAFDRWGVQPKFYAMFAADLAARGLDANTILFRAQAWFTGACLLLLLIVPAVYLRAFPEPHTWGLGAGGTRKHLPIYGLLMALMLPVLWFAAGTASFHNYYPLYKPDTLSIWLYYECLYLLQFVCVEFFFRGPILMRLERRIGMAAIGVMTVPYALIHIYKPMPEAVGSIFAGLLLGYLAVKARTIWLGVLLHCGVAAAMDVFAMIRSGRLEQLVG